jgi:DNA-binding NarL/FixJ family response regulator
VVLLDIEMGGMKGVDALRPIRALAPSVRVLIMTAFFDPIYETKARRGGASAFLVKSTALTRMVEEIHQALGRPIPVITAEPRAYPKPARVVAACPQPARAVNLFPRAGVWLSQLAAWFRWKEAYRPAPVAGLALPQR